MLALLVLFASARAGTGTLALPAGEDQQVWQTAVHLAGLDLAVGEAGATLLHDGSRWAVDVRSASGTHRVIDVAPPSSEQAREEIASLAASLLADLSRPAGAVPAGQPPAAPPSSQALVPEAATPAAPPRPVAPTPPWQAASVLSPVSPQAPRAADEPSPAPATTSSPVAQPAPASQFAGAGPVALPPANPAALPVAAPAGAAPIPVAPAAEENAPTLDPTDLASRELSENPADPVSGEPLVPEVAGPSGLDPDPVSPRPRAGPGGWIELATAVTWRAGEGSGAAITGGGGARLGPLDLGLALGWRSPRLLDAVATNGTVSSLDLAVAGRWMPSMRIAPLVALNVGASLHTFRDGRDVLMQFTVPFAGADVGVGVRVGSQLLLAPQARVRCDLATTTVQQGSTDPNALGTWDLGGGVALVGRWP